MVCSCPNRRPCVPCSDVERVPANWRYWISRADEAMLREAGIEAEAGAVTPESAASDHIEGNS